MKLSVIIICWNDREVIGDCLASLFAETRDIDLEVVVTDNGSTDGSIEFVRSHYPRVRILRHERNLGFAGANNRAVAVATGNYVLFLNPDTIIRDRAVEKLVAQAKAHPEGGAFGCRVLNPDGSYQRSAYPIPSVRSYLVAALGLRFLGYLSPSFISDIYVGWQGRSDRQIGFQAGCCLLLPLDVARALHGFDEQLFHQFEDADLCFRVWKSGRTVLFFASAEIVHIGGRQRGRYPLPVVLETHRSRYRFFFKHYGLPGLNAIRRVTLVNLGLRFAAYSLLSVFRRQSPHVERLAAYRMLLKWHAEIDPGAFVLRGREPDVGVPFLQRELPASASPL